MADIVQEVFSRLCALIFFLIGVLFELIVGNFVVNVLTTPLAKLTIISIILVGLGIVGFTIVGFLMLVLIAIMIVGANAL